jgi:hypothetical protein
MKCVVGCARCAPRLVNQCAQGSIAGYKCHNGIAYETRKTPQADGRAASGDGTVPYASMAYCKKWKSSESTRVLVTELDKCDHRDILKDARFVEYVCFNNLVCVCVCVNIISNILFQWCALILACAIQMVDYLCTKITTLNLPPSLPDIQTDIYIGNTLGRKSKLRKCMLCGTCKNRSLCKVSLTTWLVRHFSGHWPTIHRASTLGRCRNVVVVSRYQLGIVARALHYNQYVCRSDNTVRSSMCGVHLH